MLVRIKYITLCCTFIRRNVHCRINTHGSQSDGGRRLSEASSFMLFTHTHTHTCQATDGLSHESEFFSRDRNTCAFGRLVTETNWPRSTAQCARNVYKQFHSMRVRPIVRCRHEHTHDVVHNRAFSLANATSNLIRRCDPENCIFYKF